MPLDSKLKELAKLNLDLKLANFEDAFDRVDILPDPTPYDPKGSVTDNSILQNQFLNKPILDTSLNPFVPAQEEDLYEGPARLQFARTKLPPRRAHEDTKTSVTPGTATPKRLIR